MSAIWNASEPNGGDSVHDAASMNAQYSGGDIAYVLFSAIDVWIMIPGIGFVSPVVTTDGAQVLLCWIGEAEEFSCSGVSEFDGNLGDFFSGMCLSESELTAVVFVGLLTGFFAYSKRIHWEFR
jgi:hypothetical protein